MRVGSTWLVIFVCAFSSQAHAQWSCSGIARLTSGNSVRVTGAGESEPAAQQSFVANCYGSASPGFIASCTVTACTPPVGGGKNSATPAPNVEFCVAQEAMTTPLYTGEVQELFGERAGVRRACAISAPGDRVSKVYCFMYNGYAKDAPPDLAARMQLPGCKNKFYDTSACSVRYAAVHALTNYINTNDQHVVCADALGERGSGAKGWGIVSGR